MSPELLCIRAGLIPYPDAVELQLRLAEARREGRVGDVLVLLEHPPVYTRGRRSEPGELPMGEQWYAMQGIELAETDRGGRVTYHGPGQLVAYPILDLSAYGDDVHEYVRMLERVMIAALGDEGVEAQVFAGLTGVWTAGPPPLQPGEPGPQGTEVAAGELAGDGPPARKIGSIGVHLSRGITTHGLAVNVANDLQPFEWIVPCGIDHVRMTSVSAERGERADPDRFADRLVARFAEEFGREPVAIGLGQLLERAGVTSGAIVDSD